MGGRPVGADQKNNKTSRKPLAQRCTECLQDGDGPRKESLPEGLTRQVGRGADFRGRKGASPLLPKGAGALIA